MRVFAKPFVAIPAQDTAFTLQGNVVSTPEPSTAALLALGMLALIRMRRRL